METAGDGQADGLDSRSWPQALRRYVVGSLGLHALWEVLQLPLYTIWTTGSRGERWFAVAHCTLGDMVIATVALVMALASVGKSRWPREPFGAVAGVTLVMGLGYTIYSEWLNVVVRKSWAYAASMPTVPPLGTGVSPLLQWVIVPGLVLWFTRRWAC